MTAKDVANGAWWGADVPPHGQWHCPKCEAWSPVSEWREVSPYCEDCGEHDGRECPRCEEWFDHVWDDEKLASASAGELP